MTDAHREPLQHCSPSDSKKGQKTKIPTAALNHKAVQPVTPAVLLDICDVLDMTDISIVRVGSKGYLAV